MLLRYMPLRYSSATGMVPCRRLKLLWGCGAGSGAIMETAPGDGFSTYKARCGPSCQHVSATAHNFFFQADCRGKPLRRNHLPFSTVSFAEVTFRPYHLAQVVNIQRFTQDICRGDTVGTNSRRKSPQRSGKFNSTTRVSKDSRSRHPIVGGLVRQRRVATPCFRVRASSDGCAAHQRTPVSFADPAYEAGNTHHIGAGPAPPPATSVVSRRTTASHRFLFRIQASRFLNPVAG